MSKKIIFLVWLCSMAAGSVAAGNVERQTALEPVSFVFKVRKSGEIHSERGIQLRAGKADAVNIPLRSTLEPGHSRPDSALTYISGNEQPYRKCVFTYQDDTITEMSYYQDLGDGWHMLSVREEYAFDAYGNRTMYTYRSYDGDVTFWIEKEEYAYNPNGTPLYEKFYEWIGNEWTLTYEMILRYDDNGMFTGGTLYAPYLFEEETVPLTFSGTPENVELSVVKDGVIFLKTILHYDPPTMRMLGQEYFEINEDTGILEWDGMDEYTYDDDGRRLTELWWDEDYAWKTVYTYNATGQKLSKTRSSADRKEGPYTVSGKTVYEYNDNRLVQTKHYDDWDGSELTLVETTVFYYADDSGNETVRLAKVSVYPNPVTDVLIVSGAPAGAMLTIADLAGRTVGRQTLADGQATVPMASLPAGVYLVTIRSNRATATFKVVRK